MILTEEEKYLYGNRFPNGYKKVRALGKGGIAVVWLGETQGPDGEQI